MRIQLLHPPTHVSPGNLQTTRPTHPLGLAYVAAALRQAGHDCTVLDAVAEAPTQTVPAGPLMRLGLADEQILDRIDPCACKRTWSERCKSSSGMRSPACNQKKGVAARRGPEHWR